MITMKIKWIFILANSISTIIIITFLLLGYIYMVLPPKVIMWLLLITIVSSVISSYVHYLFTKPIERSIGMLTEQSRQIANGKFEDTLPVAVAGPVEIRELTQRFNEMNTKLAEAFQQIKRQESTRRELVANISHDLRTPMSSIKAFVSAIQDGVVQDEETYSRYLKTISLETERLDELIQQLFQLSLLDSGAIEIHRERTNLDDLLLSVLEHEQIHLEQKGLTVDVDIPKKLPAIYIDRSYFQQVLYNLIDNAIRYSPEGGRIEITVSVLNDRKLTIAIKDYGMGIAKEDLPYIFERTYRVEKSRNQKYGGSGLGLAIAKTIVERHEGKLTVSSEHGKGSVFSIFLSL